MSVKVDEERCVDCGVCTGMCNYEALSLNEDWSLSYSSEKCVDCGLCIASCPLRAIQ